MVPIEARPEHVKGGKLPGHGEDDFVIGKQGKMAMGTLVERKSTYFVRVALLSGRDAPAVREWSPTR